MDIRDVNNLNKTQIFDNCIGMGKRYFSVKSLAKYLDISEPTLRKWIDKGSIPFLKVNNSNTIRFDIFKIEKWINTF